MNDYKNSEFKPLFFHTMAYCRSCRRRFYAASALYRAYAYVVGHAVFNVDVYIAYLGAYNGLRTVYHALKRFRREGWSSLKPAVPMEPTLPASNDGTVASAFPLRTLTTSGRFRDIDVKVMREESKIKSNV